MRVIAPGVVEFGNPGAPVSPRNITRLAFRLRLTRAEKIALEIACLDNPAATLSVRQAAAALRVDMADINAAGVIDLDSAGTQVVVQALETATILSPARSAAVLAGVIASAERA